MFDAKTLQSTQELIASYFNIAANDTSTLGLETIINNKALIESITQSISEATGLSLPDAGKQIEALQHIIEQFGFNVTDLNLANASQYAQSAQDYIASYSLDDLQNVPTYTLEWLKDGGFKQIASSFTGLQMMLLAYTGYHKMRAGNKHDAAFDLAGIAARATGFNFTSLGGLSFLTEIGKGCSNIARGEPLLGVKHFGEAINRLAAFALPTLSIYGGTTIAAWASSPAVLALAIPATGFILYKTWGALKSATLSQAHKKTLEKILQDVDIDPAKLSISLTLFTDPNFLLSLLSKPEVLEKAKVILAQSSDALIKRSPEFAPSILKAQQIIKLITQTEGLEKLTLEKPLDDKNIQIFSKLMIPYLKNIADFTADASIQFLTANPEREKLFEKSMNLVYTLQKENAAFKASFDQYLGGDLWTKLNEVNKAVVKSRNDRLSKAAASSSAVAIIEQQPKPVIFSGGGSASLPGGASGFVQSSGCSMSNDWITNPINALMSWMPGSGRHRSYCH